MFHVKHSFGNKPGWLGGKGMRNMGKMLYLECSSGISGDMAVAALLDAGASEEAVRAALASLPVDGFEVRISRVVKSGLDVCDFDVILDDAHQNHDHDMAYLHGSPASETASPEDALPSHASDRDRREAHAHDHAHDHAHGHAHGLAHAHAHGREHDHGHDRAHSHEHDHDHDHDPMRVQGRGRDCDPMDDHAHARGCGHDHDYGHNPLHDHQGHGHEHRGMAEIGAILDVAAMTDGARGLARRIFEIIARAEAEAHGVPVDQVHFHEVGAVDSIADIVAAAVALDDLASQGIDEVVVTELAEGRGTIRCQHGIIPVPAPAVVNIARAEGLPLRLIGVDGELVTPTGAAIAAAARTRASLPERFTIDRVGMGAGKRAYETPGILRALVIEGE